LQNAQGHLRASTTPFELSGLVCRLVRALLRQEVPGIVLEHLLQAQHVPGVFAEQRLRQVRAAQQIREDRSAVRCHRRLDFRLRGNGEEHREAIVVRHELLDVLVLLRDLLQQLEQLVSDHLRAVCSGAAEPLHDQLHALRALQQHLLKAARIVSVQHPQQFHGLRGRQHVGTVQEAHDAGDVLRATKDPARILRSARIRTGLVALPRRCEGQEALQQHLAHVVVLQVRLQEIHKRAQAQLPHLQWRICRRHEQIFQRIALLVHVMRIEKAIEEQLGGERRIVGARSLRRLSREERRHSGGALESRRKALSPRSL